MSSSLTKLNEAEIPVLMRHLDKFTAFFSRPAITQRTSIAGSEEFVEELITEITDCYKKARECINVAFKIHQIYEKTNEKLRKISYKNEALKNQVEEMKNHIQDQANEYIVKEKRLESLSHDLYDTEQGFKAMVSENKQLKRDLIMLKKEISMREEGTRARASSQEVKRPPPDFKQEQINALQAELKKQIEEGEGLVFQIKDLENLLKIEKTNSERLKISNGALRKELDDTNEELENLQNEKSELIEQSEIYKSEIIQQRMLIENLKRIQERDRMRATFTSEAGFSNHAEDEESPTANQEVGKENNQTQYKITTSQYEGDSPRGLLERKINQWRKTMTENLGEMFDVEEEVVDDKQFFVLSSSNSVYGQFPSFVDSVKDRPNLSEENLQSISIEGKAKRKNEITKIFELQIKKKEQKLQIVEMEIQKVNSMRILPFKDFSRLRLEKLSDIFALKNKVELFTENLPIVTVIEDRKIELSIKSMEKIEIKKQNHELYTENLPLVAVVEHRKERLSIGSIEKIEIKKQETELKIENLPISVLIEHRKNELSIKSMEIIEIKKQETKLDIEHLPEIRINEKINNNLLIEETLLISIKQEQIDLSIDSISSIFIKKPQINNSIEEQSSIFIATKEKENLSLEDISKIKIESKQKNNFSTEKLPSISMFASQNHQLLIEQISTSIISSKLHEKFPMEKPEIETMKLLSKEFSIEKSPPICVINSYKEILSVDTLPITIIECQERILSIECNKNEIAIKKVIKEFAIEIISDLHIKPKNSFTDIVKNLEIAEVYKGSFIIPIKPGEKFSIENNCLLSIASKNSWKQNKMSMSIQDISISIPKQNPRSSISNQSSITTSTLDTSNFLTNDEISIESTPVLSLKSPKIFTFEVKNQNQIGISSQKSEEMSLETTPILKLESQSTGHSSPSLEIHTQYDSIFIQSPKAQNLIFGSVPLHEDKKYTHTFAIDIDQKDFSMETASTNKDDGDKFLQQKSVAEKEPEILIKESISIKNNKSKKSSPYRDEKNKKSKKYQTFANSEDKSENFELEFLKSIKSPETQNLQQKKNRKNRHTNQVIFTKDPIKQFFILTCEAAKLNSAKRDYIGQIPFDILYNKVFEEHIPFNSWHDYIQKFLHSKTSAINV